MKFRIVVLFASIFCGVLTGPMRGAAQPKIDWAVTYGGTQIDQAKAIIQTRDGGYAFVGSTQSRDGDVTKHFGGYDFWFVKISSSGALQAQKSFGGSGLDQAFSIKQTFDGGYIIGGQTQSNDSLLRGELHGGTNAPSDAWVIKLDSLANIQWQHTFGGSAADVCNSIIQTSDSGYAFTGTTHSKDGDVIGNKGLSNLWVVKLKPSGTVAWSKCFGGSYEDGGNSLIQSSTGDLLVAGFATSSNGDVIGNHGSYDFWVLRIDTSGKLVWETPYGGSGQDVAYSITENSDHTFAVAGSTVSNDQQVSGLHNPSGGNSDCWVIKIGSGGEFLWGKTFGGSSEDYAYSIIQTHDLGYAIGATTLSNDGDVQGFLGGASDMWVVKLSSQGAIQWQKPLGGSEADQGYAILETPGFGYIVAGETASSDSDVQMLHSLNIADAFVVKLMPNNASVRGDTPLSNFALSVYPNPARTLGTFDFHLGSTSAVSVGIYYTLGQLLLEKYEGVVPAGDHEVQMDLSSLRSGEYFVRVRSNSGTVEKALILER